MTRRNGYTVAALPEVRGERIGWRQWNLRGDYMGVPILESPTYPTLWRGPVLLSDKVPTADPPLAEQEVEPKGNNPTTLALSYTFRFVAPAHGIHAFAAPDRLDGAPWAEICALGAVALSGVVVEAERGYRAERATVQRLWVRWPIWAESTGLAERPSNWRQWRDWRLVDVLDALAERYQCPVAPYTPGCLTLD